MNDSDCDDKANSGVIKSTLYTVKNIGSSILFNKKLWVFLFSSFSIMAYAIYFEELDTIQRRVTAPLIVFLFMIGILTFILPSK